MLNIRDYAIPLGGTTLSQRKELLALLLELDELIHTYMAATITSVTYVPSSIIYLRYDGEDWCRGGMMRKSELLIEDFIARFGNSPDTYGFEL